MPLAEAAAGVVPSHRTVEAAAVAAPAADIAMRNLSVRYGDGPHVFTGVDLDIRPGEQVALIGANGSGKSTLLKCCLGLVRPDSGSVRVFGEPVEARAGRRQRRLRSTIGFVAQAHNLVLRLSVLSNVVHGLLARHPGPLYWSQALAPAAARDRAMAALDLVGLADLAQRRADALSGGQSQRVAIARALVGEPRMILADEPAASLDPTVGEEVMETFAKVGRELGTTLVFTTHHLDHALRYSQRVVGLRSGRLALDSPASRMASGELLGLYGTQ